jgi:serine/threonine protein phosphatase PrpC
MKAVSLSNRGGRDNNEDSVRYANSGEIWCFVLCDGLGGHNSGEIASRIAAEAICAEFEKKPEISEDALYKYLYYAAQALGDARESGVGGADMATTAVVLVTDGKKAVWAHTGDSRLYHIRNGEILSVTDDHSLAFLKYESGIITYDQIRTDADQSRLIGCLGTSGVLAPDFSGEIYFESGDAILLCSDGFWELVSENDMTALLKNSPSPKRWLERMLEVLHQNETEKNDNYSVIAVMI